MSDYFSQLPDLQEAMLILEHFSGVQAMAIAGSYTRGVADKWSDIDLHVFMEDGIPEFRSRRRIYDAEEIGVGYCGLNHICSGGYEPPISVNFAMDDLAVGKMECSFLWMNEKGMMEIFSRVASDSNSPEGLVGVMQEMVPLRDSSGIIARLKKSIPEYSAKRALERAARAIGEARFYRLGIRKALYRNDLVSLHQYEDILIRNLVRALYALNRTWFIDEKRFSIRTMDFEIMPNDCGSKLEGIIQKKEPYGSFAQSLAGLADLFAALARAAGERYSGCELPTDWSM